MMMTCVVFLSFLSMIVVYFPSGGDAALSCPYGFELHGAKCYIVMDVYASWAEAKEYCKIVGGKLAAIKSASEQTIISGLIFKLHGKVTNEVYWLDGSDMTEQKVWRWMGDNGASTPISFNNWAAGQPDILTEHCLEIRYDWGAKWNNHACHNVKSVICESSARGTVKEIKEAEQKSK